MANNYQGEILISFWIILFEFSFELNFSDLLGLPGCHMTKNKFLKISVFHTCKLVELQKKNYIEVGHWKNNLFYLGAYLLFLHMIQSRC